MSAMLDIEVQEEAERDLEEAALLLEYSHTLPEHRLAYAEWLRRQGLE